MNQQIEFQYNRIKNVNVKLWVLVKLAYQCPLLPWQWCISKMLTITFKFWSESTIQVVLVCPYVCQMAKVTWNMSQRYATASYFKYHPPLSCSPLLLSFVFTFFSFTSYLFFLQIRESTTTTTNYGSDDDDDDEDWIVSTFTNQPDHRQKQQLTEDLR